MGRNFASWGRWLVALTLALAAAHAGDPKNATRHREAADEMVMSRESHPVSMRGDVLGSSAVRPFEARHSPASGVEPARDKEKENGTHGVAERRPLTLFHFASKLGDVAVQPVIGPVKGAQFCVGF